MTDEHDTTELPLDIVEELKRHILLLDREIRRTRISWRWAIVAVALNLGAMIFTLTRYPW